jgi:uncharacterized membrane protein
MVSSTSRSAALALVVAGLLGTAVAPAQAASAPANCRGEGVDANAKIRYQADVVIDAPLRTVWDLQTGVRDWPSWQAAVKTSERLDHGPLRKGSRFRWTTPASPTTTLVVTSTVRQLQRQSCVLWDGPAVSEGLTVDAGVHLWTFREVDGGVLVHTEETWTGAQVEADVPAATQALGASLDQWLLDLKTTAEARDCD